MTSSPEGLALRETLHHVRVVVDDPDATVAVYESVGVGPGVHHRGLRSAARDTVAP